MLGRRKTEDYSVENMDGLTVNADLEKMAVERKVEKDADYDAVCTRNKYALSEE